jgi:butyrate kinase
MAKKIFVMNFGSTSTKVAVYKDENEIIKESIQHSQDELKQFKHIMDQKDFRQAAIRDFLSKNNIELKDFDCVITRGGCCKPIEGGIYEISEEMLQDIASEQYGVHPSNLGSTIAIEFGRKYHIPAITADTPSTDEFCSLARYSGIKEIERVSLFHALNQKAIARRYAKKRNVPYESLNLIVVHMGGGISVAAHLKGKMIDANNALNGDGPFAPERAGTLPVGQLVKMCFSGDFTQDEMLKKVSGGGGLMSYLGTNSGLEVEERINNGDEYAKEIYEAMAYQVSKEIGAAAAVLKGKVDAIIFTASLAFSELFTGWVRERVEFIAPVEILAGENEMLSLAENALRYLSGEEKPKEY